MQDAPPPPPPRNKKPKRRVTIDEGTNTTLEIETRAEGVAAFGRLEVAEKLEGQPAWQKDDSGWTRADGSQVEAHDEPRSKWAPPSYNPVAIITALKGRDIAALKVALAEHPEIAEAKFSIDQDRDRAWNQKTFLEGVAEIGDTDLFKATLAAVKIDKSPDESSASIQRLLVSRNRKMVAERPVEEQPKNVSTLLHVAAKNDNAEILGLILQEASPDTIKTLLASRNQQDETPLHVAAKSENKAIFGLILEAIDDKRQALITVDAKGDTPVHNIVLAGNEEGFKMVLSQAIAGTEQALLSLKNEGGEAPVHVAARSANAGMLRVMLGAAEDKQSFLFARSENDQTPLHIAAGTATGKRTSSEVIEVALNKVNYLLEVAGTKQDLLLTADNAGQTPMHAAATCRDPRIFTAMISSVITKEEQQKLLTVKNENLQTPLDIASILGNTEVAAAILSAATLETKQTFLGQSKKGSKLHTMLSDAITIEQAGSDTASLSSRTSSDVTGNSTSPATDPASRLKAAIDSGDFAEVQAIATDAGALKHAAMGSANNAERPGETFLSYAAIINAELATQMIGLGFERKTPNWFRNLTRWVDPSYPDRTARKLGPEVHGHWVDKEEKKRASSEKGGNYI